MADAPNQSRTDAEEPAAQGTEKTRDAGRLARLSLAALGVVFGDIATSPLYAVRECFHGDYGIGVTEANVLGVLSLMFWSLLLIVTLKYLTFILTADNHGEGGVIALTALVKSARGGGRRARWVLIAIGVFALNGVRPDNISYRTTPAE